MFLNDFNSFFDFPNGVQTMQRLQRQLNNAIDARQVRQQRYPALNVYANAEAAWVTAELPGIDAKGTEISVLGKALTIKGEHKSEPLAEGEKFVRRERPEGKFARTIELPFAVDPEKVEATYKDGVLRINLPRAERDKPKKITIS
ncbi:MAG: Hsp20/alpha crystallin family protein [Deltaproteobacteria bacterium]|nr:Hsp20/alpha crystallin family protein [Deltaproteobacteria bacterium]